MLQQPWGRGTGLSALVVWTCTGVTDGLKSGWEAEPRGPWPKLSSSEREAQNRRRRQGLLPTSPDSPLLSVPQPMLKGKYVSSWKVLAQVIIRKSCRSACVFVRVCVSPGRGARPATATENWSGS